MQRWLGALGLAAAFGGSAWVAYALTAPRPAPAAPAAAKPGPDRPAPAPAAMGDLDSGSPAAPKGAPLRLTFDDLVQWDLDPKDVQVPASILAYGGKDVDIVGYMMPYGDPDAVTEFMLMRDLGSCCFGTMPLPHHVIECRMAEGTKTTLLTGPIRVRGRFRVEEHRQGGYLISVYAMTVTECVEVR